MHNLEICNIKLKLETAPSIYFNPHNIMKLSSWILNKIPPANEAKSAPT